MKIFISYGHDDHVQVVDALFDALIREGHEPWKDDRYEGSSGIPAGRDFTELIYEVIDDSDFVIAFVTNQTKDKPYCRDERQHAYNKKGNRFIQIRMDYVDITLGNARSYIDMSDVVSGNGSLNTLLFAEKLKSLFAAFRDPASFAAGGLTSWAKFDTHLKVPGALKYHDFVASLERDDFVGRQWLLEKCKNWALHNEDVCRLFVILGEAGTGKTAFIRHLATDEELVRSVHVCVYDKPSTRTARDTLRDLAYVLAQNNSRYFDFLKMRDLEQLRDMTLDGMFEFLFVEPLKTETQKYLLVIDALDEMEENTGFRPLMKLFRQYAQQLNPNISFLLTGRPDIYITDMLKTVVPGKQLESVTLDKNVSKEDLQSFIRRKLDQLGCYSDHLAATLLDACDGNFEYLSLLFREALEEGLPVFDGMKIPRGLNERYAQYLDRRMEMADCSRLSKEQRQLLSVLSAAYEPLPMSVLCAVTGLEDYDVLDELELFGSLIRRIQTTDGEPQICLFTKSFRDFLLSRAFDKYFADYKLGNRLFAQYLIRKCSSDKALKKYPYLDQYGFVHLLLYAGDEPEEVVDCCKSLADNGVDTSQRIAGALHLGDTAAIRGYWQIRKDIGLGATVIGHLKGRHSVDALGVIISLHREEGSMATALTLQADMLLWNPTPEVIRQAEELYLQVLQLSTEKFDAESTYKTRRDLAVTYTRLGDLAKDRHTADGDSQAVQWYQKALEMDNLNNDEKPCYQTRRDLAIGYLRLGDLEYRKQTPEGNTLAEQWYRKALENYEENFRETPHYESRRGLAIAYGRLGDLEKRTRTSESLDRAEQLFRKALEMDRQNLAETPCYQSHRDVSICCTRLGNLEKLRQNYQKAYDWFLQAMEIDEQNCNANPCYESRRDLSITCNNLADMVLRLRGTEGLAQAEQWYKKALEIDEENCSTNPSYQSRRDLSVSLNRLADLLMRQRTAENIAQAEQFFLRSLEVDEQNYLENPCYESREDLSIIYSRLGDCAREKHTPEGNAQAQQWYWKSIEFDEENHRLSPSYQSRHALFIDYQRLADLLLRHPTAESAAQAEQLYQKALELLEQNESIRPTVQGKTTMTYLCAQLMRLCRAKSTPECREEAARWEKKWIKLRLK